jgi:hypothetical protein
MSGRRVALARAPRGQISWVTLLLIVLVVVGAYLAWVWVPVYYENYAVKQVVRDYMNQAIKNPNDEGLRSNMVLKIRSLAEVEGVDRWGRPARLPAVPLEDRDVRWERDTRSQPVMLHVSFDYVREVNLPLLDRVVSKTFSVDLTSDLTIPNWGPAR